MNQIPDNYRQLKRTETIRIGDLFRRTSIPTNPLLKIESDNNGCVGSYLDYTFWRRRHTKKVLVHTQNPTPITESEDAKATKKVALVTFRYKGKSRIVQVIDMNGKYLTGLERTLGDKAQYKYQFKKYLLNRLESNVVLFQYGPAN